MNNVTRIRKPNPRTLAIGDIRGPFEIVEFAGRKRYEAYNRSEWQYKVKCLRCGTEHLKTQSHLTSNSSKGCISCADRTRNTTANEGVQTEADIAAAQQALRKMGW